MYNTNSNCTNIAVVDETINDNNCYYANYDMYNEYALIEAPEAYRILPDNPNNSTIGTTIVKSNRKDLYTDTIYHSNNSGDYEYVGEAGYKYYENIGVRKRLVKVRFINTGYETIVPFTNAYNGSIKDPYNPTVFGVGYIGNITPDKYTKDEYDMWYHMLSRCYNPKNERYHKYGGAGVTVVERWFSLENFINDLPKLPGYNEMKFGYKDRAKYSLDKDILQEGKHDNEKYYGPDVCIIIKISDNSRFVKANREYKKNTSSKYFGLYKLENGNFQCRIQIDGADTFLGTYSNEIAAANMYNHVVGKLDSIDVARFINDVPYMSVSSCLEFKTRKYPIDLPKYINIPEITNYNKSINNDLTIQQKVRRYANKGKKRMYVLTEEPDNIRNNRCINRYGIVFK